MHERTVKCVADKQVNGDRRKQGTEMQRSACPTQPAMREIEDSAYDPLIDDFACFYEILNPYLSLMTKAPLHL